MKNFVAVRAAYYKHQSLTKNVKSNHQYQQKSKDGSCQSANKACTTKKKYKSAVSEFEHVLRTGSTNSANVFPEFSNDNIHFAPNSSSSCLDHYYKCMDKYAAQAGRKCRNDMNTLFEHVVILSEEHVSRLERRYGKQKVHKKIVEALKKYSNKYAREYGFTACGGVLHTDEGYYDESGKFVRNIHAHVMFFNYDFKNKKSNLRKLFKKSLDPETGRTHELNPNFVAIQDLAYECFKNLKFSRGRSKLLTAKKYLTKHIFLKKKLDLLTTEYITLSKKLHTTKLQFSEYFSKWFKKITNQLDASAEAQIAAETLNQLNDDELENTLAEEIKNIERDHLLSKDERSKISNNINKNRRNYG